jgi:AraC-like DNA-binding protein
MTDLVRSASLTHFAELCAEISLDPVALVREVDLPRRCLEEADVMIPTQSVGRLLELTAARGGEPAFGLRLAERRRLSNLGPLALIVRDQPTLRHTLEALMAHIHLHNEGLSMRVEQHSNLVTIRQELKSTGKTTWRQATELVVGVTFRVLCIFMGAGWHPRLVCFSHSAPASVAVHRRVFGRAVEFGHEFNGIVCNAGDLDAPNPGADPVMARYTRRLLENMPGRQPGMRDRVRELVVLLLPRGYCGAKTVAQHLGVDRRTVSRYLATEGTSFSAVVEEVRQELLSRYIEDGSRPLTEVSALLGFTEPSTFSRWHKKRFGVVARSRLKRRVMPVASR